MANFYIIVGTVMGTAQEVAESFLNEIQTLGHSGQITLGFKAGDLDAHSDSIILICSSNTGMGDLPQNIQALYTHLTSDFPRIAGRPYALVNLGDSSYPNFGQAGQTLHEAMLDIGAVSISPMLTFDATTDHVAEDSYDKKIREWAHKLITMIPSDYL